MAAEPGRQKLKALEDAIGWPPVGFSVMTLENENFFGTNVSFTEEDEDDDSIDAAARAGELFEKLILSREAVDVVTAPVIEINCSF